jgi:hypothetical protein
MKPTVRYRADRTNYVVVGQGALVYPLNHPSERVTGDGNTPVITSIVERVDNNGEFWTHNTHYVPVTLPGNVEGEGNGR